ncbi:MAG: tetratricopeptide repeat protein [Planctomycetota bacterium]
MAGPALRDENRGGARRVLLAVLVLGLSAGLAACRDSGPAATGADRSAADAGIQRANTLLQERRFAPALEAIDEVLARSPRHREGRLLRAAILRRLERVDEGAAVLEELRAELPDDPEICRRLAFFRKHQGRWRDAVDLFESLPPGERAPTPNDALAYAESLANDGQLVKASGVATDVLLADPWFSRAYFLFAQIDDRKGRPLEAGWWAEQYRRDQALRDAEQLAYNPGEGGKPAESTARMVDALRERGRWLEALDVAQRAPAAPAAPLALRLAIARLYCDLERPADAKAALAGLPPSAAVWAARGAVHAAAEERDAALAAYERAVAEEPAGGPWHAARDALLAAAVLPADPFATARRELRARLATKPIRAASEEYLALALLHAAHGRPDAARALALVALHGDPRRPAALRLVRDVFDRPEEAFIRLSVLSRLLRFEPADEASREDLIRHLLALDVHLGAAVGHARALVQRDPSADRLVLLARVHLAAGEREEARSVLHRALEADAAHAAARELLDGLGGAAER